MEAAGDIDVDCDRAVIGHHIKLTAGGDISARGAELRNDIPKKGGEILIDAVGQVDIEGATIVEENINPNVPDFATINGRDQVPHTGFNRVVGVPVLDD
jgi:hypothetical protein